MSTPLETWLETEQRKSKDLIYRYQTEMDQAIAVIEKLKEALEKIDPSQPTLNFMIKKSALAIDPEQL